MKELAATYIHKCFLDLLKGKIQIQENLLNILLGKFDQSATSEKYYFLLLQSLIVNFIYLFNK